MESLKNKISEIIISRINLVYFAFLLFLIQEIYLLFHYGFVSKLVGYNKFSFFYFFVYFSTTLSLNFLFFLFLSGLIILFGKFKKFITFSVILFEMLYTVSLYADFKALRILGVHLSNDIFLDFIDLDGVKKYIFNGSVSTLSVILTTFLFIVLLLLLFVFFYYLTVKIFTYMNFNGFVKTTVFISFLFIYPSLFFYLKQYPVITAVPYYDFFEKDLNLEWFTDNYPKKIPDINLKKTPNIVIVLSESTRNDMFNNEYMPKLKKFTKENSCITSLNNFSGAHTTYPSFFSLIYGIYGYNGIFFNNQIKNTKPLTLEILRKHKYKTLLFTASYLESSVTKNMLKDFDVYRYFEFEDNGKSDLTMLESFKNYYEKNLKNTKEPYFLVLFIYAPHYAYNYPSSFEKYKPVISLSDKNLAVNSNYMDKKYRKELFNRYRNSVLYTDELLSKITNILKDEIDNKNLIFFYTGDHGEEFWEHGGFGHFNTSFIKERVETPFVLCLPEIDKKELYFSSTIDFFPTVFDYMTEQNYDNLKKYFNGISLISDDTEHRYLIISSHSFGSSNNKVCLVNKYGKTDIKYNLFRNPSQNNLHFGDIKDYDENIIKDAEIKEKIIKDIEKFKAELSRFIKLK